VPIKAAMVRAGIIGSEEVRPPLCEMSAANRQSLERAIAPLDK
jgi:4-hydroxy-tetrahydrodipicolinate synthase